MVIYSLVNREFLCTKKLFILKQPLHFNAGTPQLRTGKDSWFSTLWAALKQNQLPALFWRLAFSWSNLRWLTASFYSVHSVSITPLQLSIISRHKRLHLKGSMKISYLTWNSLDLCLSFAVSERRNGPAWLRYSISACRQRHRKFVCCFLGVSGFCTVNICQQQVGGTNCKRGAQWCKVQDWKLWRMRGFYVFLPRVAHRHAFSNHFQAWGGLSEAAMERKRINCRNFHLQRPPWKQLLLFLRLTADCSAPFISCTFISHSVT